MELTDELIEKIMLVNGISRKGSILAAEIKDIVYTAQFEKLWSELDTVRVWEIQDPDSGVVFLVTFDFPGGLRLGTTSFDMKDMFGFRWEHPTVGAQGVRQVLTYIDTLIRNRLEMLTSHVHNTLTT